MHYEPYNHQEYKTIGFPAVIICSHSFDIKLHQFHKER